MERPLTPSGAPPDYAGDPPSYSDNPNENTPTNMANNGSTMRLLSLTDNIDQRS